MPQPIKHMEDDIQTDTSNIDKTYDTTTSAESKTTTDQGDGTNSKNSDASPSADKTTAEKAEKVA